MTLRQKLVELVEDKRDPLRRQSTQRFIILGFFLAMLVRLLLIWTPLGWPDAFVVVAVLFALGVAKAIEKAPPDHVVSAFFGAIGRGSENMSSYFGGHTSPPIAAGPGVLAFEELVPPVAHGRPTEEDE